MSTLRKARREQQRRLAALDNKTRAAANELLIAEAKKREADANALNEKVKADELFQVARDKCKEDMQAAYDRRLMEMKLQMEKEANQQIRHYSREVESKLQKTYHQKFLAMREQTKDLLLGEYITMTAFILHDYFGCDKEGMRKYVLELMRLAQDLEDDERYNKDVEPDKQLTLDNIVADLDAADFHLTECLESVDIELEKEKLYHKFPYVFEHKGWTEEDDTILRGMILKDFDYLTIARKLQKTEGAVKSRAFRLWDTSNRESLRKKLKEKAVA